MDTPNPAETAGVQPSTPSDLVEANASNPDGRNDSSGDALGTDTRKPDLSTYEELGQARNEVKELRASLTASRFELEAAKAGAQIEELLPYLNMSLFVTAEGSPDLEKIRDFISLLGTPLRKPAFTQDVFSGSGGGSIGCPRPDRPESFRGMTPAQITEYAKRAR